MKHYDIAAPKRYEGNPVYLEIADTVYHWASYELPDHKAHALAIVVASNVTDALKEKHGMPIGGQVKAPVTERTSTDQPPWPPYDPAELIPRGAVFYDVKTRSYINEKDEVVATKMSRLKDPGYFDLYIRPRIRDRQADLPETTPGRWEDDGGAVPWDELGPEPPFRVAGNGMYFDKNGHAWKKDHLSSLGFGLPFLEEEPGVAHEGLRPDPGYREFASKCEQPQVDCQLHRKLAESGKLAGKGTPKREELTVAKALEQKADVEVAEERWAKAGEFPVGEIIPVPERRAFVDSRGVLFPKKELMTLRPLRDGDSLSFGSQHPGDGQR